MAWSHRKNARHRNERMQDTAMKECKTWQFQTRCTESCMEQDEEEDQK